MGKQRSRDKTKPSPASVALDRILLEDGPTARSLRLVISRQQLGKWRAAKRRPAPEGAKIISIITKDRIGRDDWIDEKIVRATLARLARLLAKRNRETTAPPDG
jgi:hypothetical protein